MSHTEQGRMPGDSGVPSIVKVLPLVVYPYMNTVPLYPWSAALVIGLAMT